MCSYTPCFSMVFLQGEYPHNLDCSLGYFYSLTSEFGLKYRKHHSAHLTEAAVGRELVWMVNLTMKNHTLYTSTLCKSGGYQTG